MDTRQCDAQVYHAQTQDKPKAERNEEVSCPGFMYFQLNIQLILYIYTIDMIILSSRHPGTTRRPLMTETDK